MVTASKKDKNHYDLRKKIEKFSKEGGWKWGKTNFRRITKQFSIKNAQLYYKESRIVVVDKDCQFDIIHDIHKVSGGTGKIAASFF